MKSPTPHQLEALRAAIQSGSLRRLPGGYWVRGDYPEVPRDHTPDKWISTQTIQAATIRKWFTMEKYFLAYITDLGREVEEQHRHVDNTDGVREHNRIAAQ